MQLTILDATMRLSSLNLWTNWFDKSCLRTDGRTACTMYLSYLLAAYCAQEVEERGKAAAGYLLFGLLTPSFFALFWQKEGKKWTLSLSLSPIDRTNERMYLPISSDAKNWRQVSRACAVWTRGKKGRRQISSLLSSFPPFPFPHLQCLFPRRVTSIDGRHIFRLKGYRSRVCQRRGARIHYEDV